jgi:hypothetical protein
MNKYIYEIKPFHKKVLHEVGQLNTGNLYYYVIEQNFDNPPLTLPELKKCIYRSIKKYVKELLGYKYKIGSEDTMIKYFCFFETSKEFCLSQTKQNIFDWDYYTGFHFHLFISSSYNEVSFSHYTHFLYQELTSIPVKKTSLLKYDYGKLNVLENDFILYHTKQWKDRYENELILKN